MMRPALAWSLCFLACAPAALAQQDADDPTETGAFRDLMVEEANALSLERPQDNNIIDLVERIMMIRLAHTLGLGEAQVKALVHRVGDSKEEVYNLKWLRAEKRQELRITIAEGDTARIERQLDELLRIEVTIARLIRTMIERSKTELSAEQAARFYLFIEEFEEDISRTIELAQKISDRKKAAATQPGENTAARNH